MDLSNLSPTVIYSYIFISQIVLSALGTYKIILNSKGEKIVSSIVTFISSLISIISLYLIFDGGGSDWIRPTLYVIATTIGCYYGVVMDEKLAIGKDILTIIIDEEHCEEIVKTIRDKQVAVTVLDGKGIELKRKILLIAIDKKKEKNILKLIKNFDDKAVILDESVSNTGGYY